MGLFLASGSVAECLGSSAAVPPSEATAEPRASFSPSSSLLLLLFAATAAAFYAVLFCVLCLVHNLFLKCVVTLMQAFQIIEVGTNIHTPLVEM